MPIYEVNVVYHFEDSFNLEAEDEGDATNIAEEMYYVTAPSSPRLPWDYVNVEILSVQEGEDD
jgi:hypothetical protein